MISVIIPTLNASRTLPQTLSALVPGAVSGLIREVIVVDGGSNDDTAMIAEGCGADVVTCLPSRGGQLAAGAARARFGWLMFLHADTALEAGFELELSGFIAREEAGGPATRACAFSFALDDSGFAPRFLERMVGIRANLLGRPWGDQGLVIPARLYRDLGGYRPLPLMEDVDLVTRLGRRRITVLRSRAMSSAARYRREGYVRRVARNRLCLTLYALGVPAHRIAAIYRAGSPAGEPDHGQRSDSDAVRPVSGPQP